MSGSTPQMKRSTVNPIANAYELLIQGVVDYAIYMLDPDGRVVSWNPGAETDQGLHGRRDHRRAFLALLYRRGPRRRRSRAGAADRGRDRPFHRRGLAVPQGRQPLLGHGGHRSHPPGRQAGRLRQDHPRHDRAAHRAAGGAGERAALPPAGAGRHRLRDLHARPGRHVTNWNAGAERIKGYTACEIVGRAFLPLLHARGHRGRRAGEGAGDGAARGPLRSRRAGAAARTAAASGPACDRRHLRRAAS